VKRTIDEIEKLDKEWRIDPMHWKAKELTKKKRGGHRSHKRHRYK